MKRPQAAAVASCALPVSALALACAVASPASFAQGAGQLEEVVVTARKREESLQRVPVAVSVLGQQALRDNLADNLTKLGEIAPQVSLSQGGSGTGAVITVRGVSSASNDAGLDQSVAIEVDGVPISRGQVISASLFDLEQIQVLQGPQALFFGKNSPAGVISLSSARPTEEYEGYVTAGYEFEADQTFIEGAISGPIAGSLKGRLAVRASEMDGWIDNEAEPVADFLVPGVTDPGAAHGDTLPEEDITALRLGLLWTPADSFDARFTYLHNQQERNAGNASSEPFCVGSTTAPVIAGVVPIPGGDCKKNRRTVHGAVAPEFTVNIPYSNGGIPYFDSQFDFAALTLNLQFDALTLTSTTGYYDQTVQQMSVSDWSPYAAIWAASKEEYDLLTQELRLSSSFDGPINFMLGVYYETFDREFFNSADLFHAFDVESQSYAAVMMDANNDGDYTSAFGQLTWDISDALELAVGARWSDDQKDASIVNLVANPAYGLYPRGEVLKSSYDDSNVSPEATLSWYLDDDQTLYAAYKTGYKAGGISNPFLPSINATPENLQFEPEEAEGFEVGYKASLLERRLRLDLVAYSYDYKDLQVVSYNSETISFTINNAASADIEGVQGSFEWLLLDDLTLRGNFGYNKAEYSSFPNAQCYPGQTEAQGCVGGQQDLAGEALLRAPDWTYSIGADYSPALISGWDTTVSVNASYSDEFETATDNAPAGHQDDFWLLNAGLRVGPQHGHYEFAVIGRNLTDEYYMLNSNGWSGSSNPEQQVGFFNRPREIVLQATLRF
ncbi:TonB-dependent receptor [Mangrovimicrobium sediminis]|uniref:TonB-dependent receptor n=1 Tax=Mangrovimicrobium sediminis TaxID=2562682 RepID=A0A4Z0LVC7_9GAMM|nr:TonB-dependent receptor [Haliea sp. SAOS-164]TGD71194.1 TonB-dependent receptor [Haliea sp. SAOS-164]